MIKAGTVWVCGDQRCEFLKDAQAGDVVDCDLFLINGKRPQPNDSLPLWMLTDGEFFCPRAPDGVEVILPDEQ